MEFISCENLYYEYLKYDTLHEKKRAVNAVNNINLSFKQGEFTAILGHNGSGKSTLAKALNAVLMPSKGVVTVMGRLTSDKEKQWEIRRDIGMVFQNPDNQIVSTIVEDDVAFAPENLGVEPLEIKKKVFEALEAVDMLDYRESSVEFLSGGQKQRIAIAGILAMKPKCIIFDEATAMLDPIGRNDVLKIIERLKNEKTTVILITHFMEEAILADRVIVMENGQAVMDDVPAKVFGQVEKIRELSLELPQVTEIAYELNKCGFKISNNIIREDDLLKELLNIGFKNKIKNIDFKKDERNNNNILEVKNLNYIYNKFSGFEKKALDNISFNVKKGEFLGIIGSTGSGKTTLIQNIAALLIPDEGEILLNGSSIFNDRKVCKNIRENIGIVFQYSEYQFFEENVYDEVAFAAKNLKLSFEEVNKRVKEALEAVGLNENYYNVSPFDLSGGEKRRVAIASILVMKPNILILDEPTAGLDPLGRKELLNNIQKLREEYETTIILVSHSMDEIFKYSDKVIIMKDGKISFNGMPLEIICSEELLKGTGIILPQVSLLMKKLSKLRPEIKSNIFSVEDAVEFFKLNLSEG